MFKSSIVEYTDRGPYGDSYYRGNTTGHIVKDYLEYVHRVPQQLFCDPAEGSGTSKDVAKEMGIRYTGLDLKDGFNLVKDDLGAKLGERPQTVFFHPPYAGMIEYSGNLWGNAHPDDLSRCRDVNDFLEKLQLAMANIYDALASGGHYAILMGNWRKNGVYHPLCALTEIFAPGKLREEIIKIQSNPRSNDTRYKNMNFVPIMHEKLLIFQKDQAVCSLDYAFMFSDKLHDWFSGTWRNVIRCAFRKAGRNELTLQEIYEIIEGTPRTKTNEHWQAKVRQELRRVSDFKCTDRGRYALAA